MELKGKYKLQRRLGGGGMAEVFVGTAVGARGFAREVAIKRILPAYWSNPDFARMFVAEAQVSATLSHPNVVSVLDFDTDEQGGLFLVMELVQGVDLHQLSDSGPLPTSVIIHVVAEALRGLGYAHTVKLGGSARGVVHRDVSPHNILLSWEGAVKVSDFGLAKARSAGTASASEVLKGKPAYMSPEQANSQSIDGRSDLFSVGVILWELLAGRRLFQADDLRATLASLFFRPIPPPSTLRANVPADLERVAMKLLERDLPARYQTAEEAVADLLRCGSALGGRDELIAVLVERFPQIAPSRDHRVVTLDRHGDAAVLPPAVASEKKRIETAIDGRHRRGTRVAFITLVVVSCGIAAAVLATWSRPRIVGLPTENARSTRDVDAGLEVTVEASKLSHYATDDEAVPTELQDVLGPACMRELVVMKRLSQCPNMTDAYRAAYANRYQQTVAVYESMKDKPLVGQDTGCQTLLAAQEQQLIVCPPIPGAPLATAPSHFRMPTQPVKLADNTTSISAGAAKAIRQHAPNCLHLLLVLDAKVACERESVQAREMLLNLRDNQAATFKDFDSNQYWLSLPPGNQVDRGCLDLERVVRGMGLSICNPIDIAR